MDNPFKTILENEVLIAPIKPDAEWTELFDATEDERYDMAWQAELERRERLVAESTLKCIESITGPVATVDAAHIAVAYHSILCGLSSWTKYYMCGTGRDLCETFDGLYKSNMSALIDNAWDDYKH